MLNIRGDRARAGLFMGILLSLVLIPVMVGAQDFEGFDVQRFRPNSSQRLGYFQVEAGESLPGGAFEVGLFFHYSDDVFVATRADNRLFSIVSGQLYANLYGTYSIIDNLQLSLDIPTILYQSGGEGALFGGPDAIEGGGLGDIRFTPKWTFYDGHEPGETGLAAAVLVSAYIPTGDPASFQGEAFRIEPRVALDLRTASDIGIGLNLGFLIRTNEQVVNNVEIGNQFQYGVAGQVPIVKDLFTAVTEFNGSLTVGAEDLGTEENPLEWLLGGRFQFSNVYLTAGGGTGFIEGVGSPDFRAFLAVAYSQGDEVGDRDGDGYLDPDDGCPDDPEDFDNFEDEDGCPDPDNDQDTILDVSDSCPNDPEDFDDFEDSNGCPDPDNDQDTILDVNDSCPNDPEDFDGFEDEDGCPDLDNDQDGIPDVDDSCPNEPEDFDDFEDQDGCPEEGPEQIVILENIRFDYDSDVIRPESYEIIDFVADVILGDPTIQLVRIEGHTSTEGSAEHNLELSINRAASVLEYLVRRGVERERLTSNGYGETRPLNPDATDEAARETNRRVEFQILERSQ